MRPIDIPGSGLMHRAPITHVAFSPFGGELATSSYDGSAVVWRVDPNGSLTPRMRLEHRRLVNASAWAPHRPGLLATAAADKTVGIWRVDGDRPELLTLLARHTDDVNAIAWLPDGERLISVSEDSSALIWQVGNGRLLGRFSAHEGHCMGVSISPAGHVLTVGEDGAVYAGSLDSGDAPRKRLFACSVESCGWSRDGLRAAIACDDGFLRILSPELDVLDSIYCSDTAVRDVAWATDDSGRIVVGSYDASVRVLHDGLVESVRTGGRLWPRSVDSSGALVAAGSFGGSPLIFTLDGLATLNDGGPATHGPNALASAGTDLLIGLDSGALVSLPIASLERGETRAATILDLGPSPILSVASAGGGPLVGLYSGDVQYLEIKDGTSTLAASISLQAPVASLAARPDGVRHLAGTYNGEVALLAVEGGARVVERAQVHEGSVKSVAWLGNETRVTAAVDGRVCLTGPDGVARDLWRHGNLINAVSVDARGLIASASRDHTVRAGLLVDGQVARQWHCLGSDESVKAVGVLGEGRQGVVVAGSYDFALYVWQLNLDSPNPDLRAGQVAHSFAQGVSTMCVLDARRCVVASWDGSIALFELDASGTLRCRSIVSTHQLAAEAVSMRVSPLEVLVR